MTTFTAGNARPRPAPIAGAYVLGRGSRACKPPPSRRQGPAPKLSLSPTPTWGGPTHRNDGMMFTKKWRQTALVGVLPLIALAAACGGEKGTAATTTAAAATTTAAPALLNDTATT